jgi:hypothetical protein
MQCVMYKMISNLRGEKFTNFLNTGFEHALFSATSFVVDGYATSE